MIYKLGNIVDMKILPPIGKETWKIIYDYVSILTREYGADRNVDLDDGGYVIYASPGTRPEEIKSCFDFTKVPAEYVQWNNLENPPQCVALYLLNNEYAVVIIVSEEDVPEEIKKDFLEERK